MIKQNFFLHIYQNFKQFLSGLHKQNTYFLLLQNKEDIKNLFNILLIFFILQALDTRLVCLPAVTHV